MRKPFIAGNWKMNMDRKGSEALAKGLAQELADIDSVDMAVCPPYVYLDVVANALANSNIALGSQNVYFEEKGAFTGEISCAMLKDICCTYAIIGHSERRHVMGEDDELINKKVSMAVSSGLLPILCVGELLEQREAGKTDEIVKTQVEKGLAGLSKEKVEAITIAYEPVWAIGTGKTATKEQAQEVHAMIRALLEKMYDKALAEHVRIQYGGSAKPANCEELMSQPDVDGLLVGGASLKVQDFADMIKKTSKL